MFIQEGKMNTFVRRTMLGIGLACAVAGNAGAYQFSLTEFGIDRNGIVFFEDTFSDGLPPPNRAGATGISTANYAVAGTVGPENSGGNGKLVLDQSGAVFGTGLFGDSPNVSQRVRLATNTNSANTTDGLKRNMVFNAFAGFDLIAPAAGQSYGIRLGDNSGGSAGNSSDIVDLRVRNVSGTPRIQFRRTDLASNTQVAFEHSLELGHDQIFLVLEHPMANTDTIFARYLYVDGGIIDETKIQTFSQTVDIFQGGDLWTQASFSVTAAVPEPHEYALMLAGLGLVGCAVRRRTSCKKGSKKGSGSIYLPLGIQERRA